MLQVFLLLLLCFNVALCFRSISHSRVSFHLSAGMTPLTANGKRVEVPAGSSLLAATKKLGLKVPLSCKKGDCGTCTVSVGGKNIRACVGKVPDAPKLKSLIEKGLPVKVAN